MAKNDIWTTKDGRRMKMWEMDDKHLKNAYRYFQYRKHAYPERWHLLKTEVQRRKKFSKGFSLDSNRIDDGPIRDRFEILDL